MYCDLKRALLEAIEMDKNRDVLEGCDDMSAPTLRVNPDMARKIENAVTKELDADDR